MVVLSGDFAKLLQFELHTPMAHSKLKTKTNLDKTKTKNAS